MDAFSDSGRVVGVSPSSHQTSASNSMGKVVMASVIGTMVEWYDFLLYGTAAALVFNKLFFPSLDPLMGTLAALGSFAVGFIARPLGGAVFGHFGDKIGRKTMLMTTMFMMGGGTFAIGLLPTYAQIGAWAPALLILLRVIQGIGIGGEWGGAALMVIEHAPRNQRGFFGSLVQIGFPLGMLASTGIFAYLSRMPDAEFLSWGWRIPFLLSSVLVLLGFYIRLKVTESPVFEAAAASSEQPPKIPLLEVLTKHKRNLLISIGLKVCEVAWVYILTVFVVVYGTTVLHIPKAIILDGVLLGAALELITIPLFGWLSDRWGRRTLYFVGSVFTIAAAYPMFLSIQTGSSVVIALTIAVCMNLGHGSMYGPQAALLPELFGTRVRYSGASLGCQVAAGIGGGLAPMLATALLARQGHFIGVAVMIAVLGAVTFIATVFSPETYRDSLFES
ncbi:shikimate transporter ShiA (plasmid) [Cupriavidus necator N-1]|uniref:Shikimate transporter ShiA n=1 Tax=Cupriavidus necator (strain ATCC 43291 / DSM 13513 / CCUG 52238 / LMG 8453 / N-1) TaxID=1042878 RepID=F8GXU3_CUPNN|nr:MFS transporter [Cupriavidus necator]AEI82163.1 shikimate transporter ShiA [Cupriavidus necator N-1]MDX6007189.1 MFS transporter [Cupriavidus necator]